MNQVVTELIVDARGATAGTAQYVAAMERARVAAEGLETVNDRAQAAQDRQAGGLTASARRAETGWKRLQSQIDPVSMSLQRIEQAQAKVDAALTRGITTQERAGRVMDAFIAKQRQIVQAAGSQAMLAAPVDQSRINQLLGVRQIPSGGARESAAAFEEAARAADQMGARVTALRAQIDPLGAAQDRLNAELAEYNAMASAGAISAGELAAAQALAQQRFAATGNALLPVAANTRLTSHEMTNLSFQLNDIAVMMASGQSPFILLMQQGMQVGQILGPRGLRGALGALGPALMSFLLSPVNLAIVAFATATAGAVALFNAVTGGADDADRHLERHRELIGQIRDQWKAAKDGVHDYAASSKAVLMAEATLNRNALEADLQAATRPFAPRPNAFGPGPAPDAMAAMGLSSATFLLFPQIKDAVQDLQESFRAGAPDVRAFRDEIAELFNAAAPGSRLRGVLGGLLRDEDLRNAAELQGQYEQARDAAEGLAGDQNKLNKALGEAVERFEAVERRVEAYGDALEELRGIAARELTDRDQAAEQLRAMVDAAQGLDDVTVALHEYAAALDRVAAAEREAEREAFGDVQFRMATMGMSERDRAMAELRRQQAEQIAAAREAGTDPVLLQRRHGLELREFDAGRQAEFNDAIAERQRALAEEAGALGLSESALAKYRTEIDLTNEAMRLFGSVSPDMAAQIAALGDAAARAVEQQRAMRDQIAAMDDLRGDVRSFLGDLAKGMRDGESAADALRNALDRLLDRLMNMGLDMIVSGLLGQQGAAGGGLLGPLLSGLFGGAGSGAGAPSASGALIGGAGSDVLIGSGGVRSGTPFASIFAAAAAKHGLSPSLLAGMARQESGFNPNAVSSAGAQGLMQLMPGTARDLGVTNAFDPTQSIFGGAQYMRQQIDRFGSVDTALAAYNAGPGRVAGAGGDLSRLPAETQAYVPAVLAHQKAFVEGAEGMADATTQAADTLAAELPQAASQMSGAINAVSQAISAAAGGGGIFGAFGGGGGPTSFFGTFLGAAGFGGAPGFTPASVFSRSRGGPVWGAGSATSDSIPALLSNGEYVINAEQTRKFFSLLEAINDNQIPGFFVGGMAGTGIGGVGGANPGTPGMGGTSTGGSNAVGSSGGVGGRGHGGVSGSPGGTSGGAQAAAGPGGVGSGHAGMGPGGIGGSGGVGGTAGIAGMGGGFGGATGHPGMVGNAGGDHGVAGPGSASQANKGDFGGPTSVAPGFFGALADAVQGFPAGVVAAMTANQDKMQDRLVSDVNKMQDRIAPTRPNVAMKAIQDRVGIETGIPGPKSDLSAIFGDIGRQSAMGFPATASGKTDPATSDLANAIAAMSGNPVPGNPFGGFPSAPLSTSAAGPSSPSISSPPTPARDTPSNPFAGFDDAIDDIFGGLKQASDLMAGANATLGFHGRRVGGVGGTRDLWEEIGRASGGMVGANDNLRMASPAWFRNAVRAHGGLRLAPDERPVIAQTGERILNRAETESYERGGRGRAAAAPPTVIQYRGGDLVVQGNVDDSTLPLIRREIAASEARQQREMAANFGQYQGRWSTLKAS